VLIGMQSWFPALIGDTGSGDGEAGAGGEPGAGGQPQGQQQDGATGAGTGDGWTPPTSQAELDKLFADRAKRAAEAETRKLLEATGAKSSEELIAAYKAQQEADELSKSEQQKLQDKIAQLEEQANAEAAKAAEAHGQLAELKRQQQFAAAAAKAGIPPDRIADAYTLSSFPDGETEPDFDKVVKATVEAKPYLADTSTQRGTSHGATGRGSGHGAPTAEQQEADRKRIAAIYGVGARA